MKLTTRWLLTTAFNLIARENKNGVWYLEYKSIIAHIDETIFNPFCEMTNLCTSRQLKPMESLNPLLSVGWELLGDGGRKGLPQGQKQVAWRQMKGIDVRSGRTKERMFE
jgi:hypothetical protein